MNSRFKMNRMFLGAVLVRIYPRLPFRSIALRVVTRLEGGALFSLTLRDVLSTHFDVVVGDYSYGSLLEPGRADVMTVIGRYCSVGPNVRRIGAAHPMHHLSLHPFWYNARLKMVDAASDVERSSCVIGDDVWIGANATILPGCRSIGTGAVVGAGAVVTRDVLPFSIVAGNPARRIGERLSDAERTALLSVRPWDLTPEQMRDALGEIQSGETGGRSA